MKKKLLIVTLLSLSLSVSAQRETVSHHENHSRNDNAHFPHTNHPNYSGFAKDGVWWEPDTVLFYSATGSAGREVYSYNAAGLLTGRLRELGTAEYTPIFEYLSTYDERNNLLFYTCREYRDTGLVNSWRDVYTYNSENQIESYSWQYWKDGNWTFDENDESGDPICCTVYVYDEEHKLIEMIVRERIDQAWRNWQRTLYEYDDNNNLLLETLQAYPINGSDFVNARRSVYTYDERNNRLSKVNQQWDRNSGTWIYVRFIPYDFVPIRWEYTYDENNNQLTELTSYFANNEWIYLLGYRRSYDQYNNMLTYSEIGLNSDSIWEDTYLETYTYNEHNKVLTCYSTIYRSNSPNRMEPFRQIIKTYDMTGKNCTSSLKQKYSNDSWVNLYYYTDMFDENGNCIVAIANEWDNNRWVDTDFDVGDYISSTTDYGLVFQYNQDQSTSRTYYYICKVEVSYRQINGTDRIVEKEGDEILLYPNPTTGTLNIKNGTVSIKGVKIFDLFGRDVHHSIGKPINSSTNIDISHLPAGIYIIKIATEKGEITRKIVKQ